MSDSEAETKPLKKVKVEPKLCNDCESNGLTKCNRLCLKMAKANEALKEMNLKKQNEIKNSEIISCKFKCRRCDFISDDSANMVSHHLESHYIDTIEQSDHIDLE